MAVFDAGQPWEAKLSLYRHRVDWTDGNPEAVAAAGEPVPIVAAEPLVEECRHFVESIVNGTPPRTDGEEGVRVLRVLHAAQESLSAGADPPAARMIHDSALVEQPSEIGAGTKIWHFTHVRAGSRIGANCSAGQNVMIGPDVTIGDGCKIQNNVSIYEGVDLGDDVFCGPSCVFTNVRNPRADVDRREEFERTSVGRALCRGETAARASSRSTRSRRGRSAPGPTVPRTRRRGSVRRRARFARCRPNRSARARCRQGSTLRRERGAIAPWGRSRFAAGP